MIWFQEFYHKKSFDVKWAVKLLHDPNVKKVLDFLWELIVLWTSQLNSATFKSNLKLFSIRLEMHGKCAACLLAETKWGFLIHSSIQSAFPWQSASRHQCRLYSPGSKNERLVHDFSVIAGTQKSRRASLFGLIRGASEKRSLKREQKESSESGDFCITKEWSEDSTKGKWRWVSFCFLFTCPKF